MKIHEYQARELLLAYGVPVPAAIVVDAAGAAGEAYAQLAAEGATLAVVKAQVHAGGRGKGGGIRLVRSAEDASEAAEQILAKPLVTPQTGPQGVAVNKLLIAAGVSIAKEYYLAIAIDRAAGRPIMIASAEGGVEIEQVAKEHPEAIVREPIDPLLGLQPYQCRKVAFGLGMKGKLIGQAVKLMQSMAQVFLKTDASLVEVNPLVVTEPSDDYPDGQLLAIDAKMNFDDNALFRHKDIKELADPAEQDAAEARADEYELNYIKLDGRIGCLVNGAGLAMATMDLVKLHGAEPANFLDVGGSASEEAVTEAFRIILDDPHVEGVLVNIFGGIARCDVIARAIIAAAKQVGFKVPVVVRLEGTNVAEARQLLKDAHDDLPTMQIGDDLSDAARKITQAVAG
jgi:succinyl-CoA synthetase beta subunit